MSGDAFKGLTLNPASGRLNYTPPDCSELNKTGVIKLSATGAGGNVTSPSMSIPVTVTQ